MLLPFVIDRDTPPAPFTPRQSLPCDKIAPHHQRLNPYAEYRLTKTPSDPLQQLSNGCNRRLTVFDCSLPHMTIMVVEK